MPCRLLFLAALLGVVGCELWSSEPPAKRPARLVPLHGGGSSFVNPLMQVWCKDYHKAKGPSVYYQSCGSGAGISHMTLQTFDFGATDGPMNDEQLQKARELGGPVIHVPLCMGAVVAAYHLPNIEKPIRFTPTVLADIYRGKIKKWNEPALMEINPGVELPDLNIVVVHRSDGSGTTYVWTDYLSKVNPDWAKTVGYGVSVKWLCGVGHKGNEGCTAYILATPGALGYIELTYALQAKLKAGIVQNRDGHFIRPTLESVTAAAVGALKELPDDLRYSLTNSPGKDSYPIVGTTWAILYTEQPGERGQALVDFLRWVTHEGQESCERLHYARLPVGLVEHCNEKLKLVRR